MFCWLCMQAHLICCNTVLFVIYTFGEVWPHFMTMFNGLTVSMYFSYQQKCSHTELFSKTHLCKTQDGDSYGALSDSFSTNSLRCTVWHQEAFAVNQVWMLLLVVLQYDLPEYKCNGMEICHLYNYRYVHVHSCQSHAWCVILFMVVFHNQR